MSTARLNAAELAQKTPLSASWHADFADTPCIFIGNMPEEMNETDLLTLFSQYGVPTHVHIPRDKASGMSRRYAFLTYEDARSCVLAVDNFDGWSVKPGHNLKVTHKYYNRPNWEDGADGPGTDLENQDMLWQREVQKQLLDKDFAQSKSKSKS